MQDFQLRIIIRAAAINSIIRPHQKKLKSTTLTLRKLNRNTIPTKTLTVAHRKYLRMPLDLKYIAVIVVKSVLPHLVVRPLDKLKRKSLLIAKRDSSSTKKLRK